MASKRAAPVEKKSDPKDWISHIDLKELKEYPESLSALCQEIKDFAYSDKAKDIDAFCRAYRIRLSKLHEWRQQLPELDSALNELKEQVHIYRRMLWADRLLSENNFLRYAHLNSDQEREINKYHDDRKKELQQGDEGGFKVLMVKEYTKKENPNEQNSPAE